jgi:hypothetical protein
MNTAPHAWLGYAEAFAPQKVARICMSCADRPAAEARAAAEGCEVTHGLCAACAAVYVAEVNARGVKFTNSEIREAIASATREEGKCETTWDLVQGLTAYARGFDFIDTRIDLEKRAGDLLKTV